MLDEGHMHNSTPPKVTTSNDLLSYLQTELSRKKLHYTIIAQSEDEVRDVSNAPAVSMGLYLFESGQTQLLTILSIYSERGESRRQVRLLYMNEIALTIWMAMGKNPTVTGLLHRPPRSALLTFGVPYSE